MLAVYALLWYEFSGRAHARKARRKEEHGVAVYEETRTALNGVIDDSFSVRMTVQVIVRTRGTIKLGGGC